jgi:hypothetical protein
VLLHIGEPLRLVLDEGLGRAAAQGY